MAPELTVVNASYNFMPVESLTILSSTLKLAKGMLFITEITAQLFKYQTAVAYM